jgi:hypothetical protein
MRKIDSTCGESVAMEKTVDSRLSVEKSNSRYCPSPPVIFIPNDGSFDGVGC